jgi:hypothetical protein
MIDFKVKKLQHTEYEAYYLSEDKSHKIVYECVPMSAGWFFRRTDHIASKHRVEVQEIWIPQQIINEVVRHEEAIKVLGDESDDRREES